MVRSRLDDEPKLPDWVCFVLTLLNGDRCTSKFIGAKAQKWNFGSPSKTAKYFTQPRMMVMLSYAGAPRRTAGNYAGRSKVSSCKRRRLLLHGGDNSLQKAN